MKKFNEARDKHIERLEQFVPIVERVHGGDHPEFKDVRILFDEINGKLKEAGAEKPEIDKEFEELRKVTDNYRVPADTCESYEAVYDMLSELDKAYHI